MKRIHGKTLEWTFDCHKCNRNLLFSPPKQVEVAVMIDRISDFNLHSGNRFLILHGSNTSDVFCSSSLQVLSIEQALNQYLQSQGFDRIIYFSESQKLYFWDSESRDRFLPQRTVQSQSSRALIKPGPFGRAAILPNRQAEQVSQPQSTGISRMRDAQCISYFESAMRSTDMRSALVFSYAEELRGFDLPRELLERIVRWSRLPPSNNNLCVMIFHSETVEDLRLWCDRYGFSYLNTLLNGNDGRCNVLQVSTPDQPEINNLIQYFRLEYGKTIDWPDLHELQSRMVEQSQPLSHWDTAIRSIPVLSLFTAKQQGWAETVEENGETIEDLLNELDSYVGLESVKASIRELVNVEIANQLLKEDGLADEMETRHMIFLGNPGTGKTTIARLLGRIYKAAGLLRKGHFVEADREKLVGGYVGQTAIKTTDVINSALDGVLFVDEAYALSRGGENDFGKESIDTLVPAMENYRDRLVVVLAGYSNEMQSFLNTNSGIKSRVPPQYQITFPDYSAADLLEIFMRFCVKGKRMCPDDVRQCLANYFQTMWENRDQNFGNGREVRNVYEAMVRRQKVRMVKEKLTGDDRLTFRIEDIPNA